MITIKYYLPKFLKREVPADDVINDPIEFFELEPIKPCMRDDEFKRWEIYEEDGIVYLLFLFADGTRIVKAHLYGDWEKLPVPVLKYL